ncbi:hypothetical protein [Vibrio cidicii]|uniref:hypothetical protein n=1 Tax=Vibrio cidicii TaxID=1763883 RepID=UPI003703C917
MSATPKFPIYQKREFRYGNHHEEEYLMIAPNYRLRVSLVWEPKPNALLHVSHEAYDPGHGIDPELLTLCKKEDYTCSEQEFNGALRVARGRIDAFINANRGEPAQ